MVTGVTSPLAGLGIPGTTFGRAGMVHLGGAPANVFYCGAECTGLSAAMGGVGGSDLVAGTYDVLADAFSPNMEAARLNTQGGEYSFMIHASGLYAVFDRAPPAAPMEVHLAARAGLGQPWQDLGVIGPLPVQGAFNPVLADHDGQTYLVHVLGSDVAMTPIDLTLGSILGASRVIVRNAYSPCPILDDNGQLIGISHSGVGGSSSNQYVALDLDPNTPSMLLPNAGAASHVSATIGGRFIGANYLQQTVHAVDAVWLTGGRGSVGASMSVVLNAPPTSSGEVYFSVLMASDAFTASGQPVPRLTGELGLHAAAVLAWPLVMHDSADGRGVMNVPISNVAGLRGLQMPAQAVTWAVLANRLWFTNTATLAVR